MIEKNCVSYSGKYIKVVNQNGWEYVKRVNCSGIAVIVALTEKSEVLLVEQFRIPVNNNVIEFPAGLVGDLKESPDELIETAAQRELIEETGFKAEKIEFLMKGPPSAGLSSEILTFFKATGLKKIGEGGGDHTESITLYKIPITGVDNFLSSKIKEGVLVDPKVYAGLYFIQQF